MILRQHSSTTQAHMHEHGMGREAQWQCSPTAWLELAPAVRPERLADE